MEESLLAHARSGARRAVQHAGCAAFHLRHQRRDARVARGALGPSERCARCFSSAGVATPMPATTSSWTACDAGGKARRVELGEPTLGLVEAPDQEEPPDLRDSAHRGVHPVAVLFERRARCVERLARPAQVARSERDFGLATTHPRARQGSFGRRRAPHFAERLGSHEIAERAIAMPRSASAGASSRRAIRLSAPSGFGPRRARAAAAVISSPPQSVKLVTPIVRCPALKMYRMTNPQERTMTQHRTGTRKSARSAARAARGGEGAHAAQRRPGAARQGMPWVRIDKEYRFDTDEGKASLAQLFPAARSSSSTTSCSARYTAGCPSCSAIPMASMAASPTWRTTTVTLRRCRGRRSPSCRRSSGAWVELPVASSLGSDFNYDFRVGYTKEEQQSGSSEYNFRRSEPVGGSSLRACGDSRRPARRVRLAEIAASVGTDWATYTRAGRRG